MRNVQERIVSHCNCFTRNLLVSIDSKLVEQNKTVPYCQDYASTLQILQETSGIAMPKWNNILTNEQIYDIYYDYGYKIYDAASTDARQKLFEFKQKNQCANKIYEQYGRRGLVNEAQCKISCEGVAYTPTVFASKWPREVDVYSLFNNTLWRNYRQGTQGRILDLMVQWINKTKNAEKFRTTNDILKNNVALLHITPSSTRGNLYKQQNTMTLLQYLSQVGGVVSLWAGISVLTVIEIIQFFIIIIFTFITKYCISKSNF